MLLVVLRGIGGRTKTGTKTRIAKTDAVDMPLLISRYSSLAMAAFVVVAVSGIARTIVAVGSWEELLSPYGLIVIGKAILLIALGLFGAWYRRRLIPHFSGAKEKRSFWTL